MGTNLALAEIRKVAKDAVEAYRKYVEQHGRPVVYPQEELDHSVANTLNELHLKVLATQIMSETKTVRGD